MFEFYICSQIFLKTINEHVWIINMIIDYLETRDFSTETIDFLRQQMKIIWSLNIFKQKALRNQWHLHEFLQQKIFLKEINGKTRNLNIFYVLMTCQAVRCACGAELKTCQALRCARKYSSVEFKSYPWNNLWPRSG